MAVLAAGVRLGPGGHRGGHPHHHARRAKLHFRHQPVRRHLDLFTQTLKKLGIEVRFFNSDHPEQIDKLVDENTRLVYLESVGNPKNDVPDFRAIADTAHKHGLPVIVDNTVLTPALFRLSSTASISRSIRPPSSWAATVSTSAAPSWTAAISSGRTIPRSGPSSPNRANRTTALFHRGPQASRQPGLHHPHPHPLAGGHGATQSPFAAFLLLLGIETCICASNAIRRTRRRWPSGC